MKTRLELLTISIIAALAFLCFLPRQAAAQNNLGATKACDGYVLGEVNGCPACMDEELQMHICKNNFPDENFRACVEEILGGEMVPGDTIDSMDSIYCNSKKIVSLRGIEYFASLKILECNSNQLTNLNLSQNQSLESLSCYSNRLSILDLSRNPQIKYLSCSGNQLTNLNLSQNQSLESLICDSNQLSILDLSRNPRIKYLSCSDNQLMSLDLRNKTMLESLYCGGNKLSAINLLNCVSLESLSCKKNSLKELDLSSCTALGNLGCYGNQLSSIRISNCQKLLTAVEMGRDRFYNDGDLEVNIWEYDKTTISFRPAERTLNYNPGDKTQVYHESLYSYRLRCDKKTEVIYSPDDYIHDKYYYVTDTDGKACYITGVDKTAVGSYEVIPESIDGLPVKGLDGDVFRDCLQLESVTIPKSIEYIGSENNGSFLGLFFGCYNLKDIYYHGTELEWRNINIGESLTDERSFGPYLNAMGDLEDANKWVVYHPLQTSLHCTDTVRRSDRVENPRLRFDGRIRGSGSAWQKELVIPSEINGVPVTTLASFALSWMDFTKVTLPGTIEMSELNSEFGALTGCKNLETIIFESGTSDNTIRLYGCFDARRIVFRGRKNIGGRSEHGQIINELFLPANLSAIQYSFTKVEKIYYAGTNDDWNDKVTLADNADLSQTKMHYLKSIDFLSLPDKLVYEVGEALDARGALLLFTYDDGTREEFPIEDYMLSEFDSKEPGKKKVKVAAGAISNSFEVQVIEGYEPGDINGDGQVNIFDVIRLLKYVTGEAVYVYGDPDVNGDFQENIFDVIRLLKFVTGENMEIH